MSTIVTLLNLPHIVDTIAVSLPFLDLLNCALVSHAWCDALVWVIWRHVVTFRQRDSIVGHHFETSTTRQILSKHATQIQAVTCGDQDILPALAESGCTALRHINYVLLDKRQPNSVESLLEPFMRLSLSDTSIATNSGILGLQRLYQLISFNPTAHSVSIEKLSLHDKKEVKELIAFIEVLDLYPSLTCLYLEGKMTGTPGNTPFDILDRRLDLINAERVKHHTIKSANTIPRSNRGPPSGSRSPTRGLHYGTKSGYGETRPTLFDLDTSVAVLQNDGILEVTLPRYSNIVRVLERFSTIQSDKHIRNDRLHSYKLLFHDLPSLSDLELDLSNVSRNQLCYLLHFPEPNLSAISLLSVKPTRHLRLIIAYLMVSGNRPDNRERPEFFRNSLVRLELQGAICMRILLEILTRSHSLQELYTDHVYFDGTEPQTCPIWATIRLRTLHLGLFVDNHPRLIYRINADILQQKDLVRLTTESV